MKIHHLNCATFCPIGGHLIDGVTPGFGQAQMVCHCLLIETEDGLVMVDTGLGTKDIQHPEKSMSRLTHQLMRPRLLSSETALSQITNLGFKSSDVRHIILTHLDFDHAGGIDDFPSATVHLMQAEKRAATNPRTFQEKNRYRPDRLSEIKEWNSYFPQGEKWFGFHTVRELEGLPPEILLVPLPGHTEGHTGVAVQTDHGWLLHAGDAYYYHGEMNETYQCTPVFTALQKIMDTDRKLRLGNLERLRQLSRDHSAEVSIFSAHDSLEYSKLKEGQPRHLLSLKP